ncbi:MAG: hypothetical protein WCA77_08220 [Thermoplasmata archaeon]
MPRKPNSIEVSVERYTSGGEGAPARVIKLTATIDPEGEDGFPSPEELNHVFTTLTQRLDAALEAGEEPMTAVRGDERGIDELIETYRPRQRELVDLLRAEGEISPREADLLRSHLESRAPRVPPPPAPEYGREPNFPRQDPSPTNVDRIEPVPRPIGELLDTYQIETLKQAGAVRARRQISFAEYMALKRHFNSVAETSPAQS